MVTNQGELDQGFGALADPTRRAIIDRLTHADATVGELAEPFRMSRPAISKHLNVLERAGLVRRVREGRTNRCQLRTERLIELSDWMTRHRAMWEHQLDRLAAYLEAEKGER